MQPHIWDHRVAQHMVPTVISPSCPQLGLLVPFHCRGHLANGNCATITTAQPGTEERRNVRAFAMWPSTRRDCSEQEPSCCRPLLCHRPCFALTLGLFWSGRAPCLDGRPGCFAPLHENRLHAVTLPSAAGKSNGPHICAVFRRINHPVAQMISIPIFASTQSPLGSSSAYHGACARVHAYNITHSLFLKVYRLCTVYTFIRYIMQYTHAPRDNK